MKKGKRWVSSSVDGFGIEDEMPPDEVMFAGYPSFDMHFTEDMDEGERLEKILERCRECLLYSDKHPPAVPGNIHSRNIYFTIVFESQDQQDDFLEKSGLNKYGLAYLMGEEFAGAFGIDMATGKLNRKGKTGKNDGRYGFDPGSFDFSGSQVEMDCFKKKKKPEVSERLKEVRKGEKDLARYLAWTAEAGYMTDIAFRTEKEKENTLKALGLQLEFGGKYLWCHDVARALGMELLPCLFKSKGAYTGREKRLEELVITEEELAGYKKMGRIK